MIGSKQKIETVQFSRNEFIGDTIDARNGLYDLICKDEAGRIFIVEMQLGRYQNFLQRTKFYAFNRFNILVRKGDFRFDDIAQIYCIGFIVKSIFPKSKEYYHFARLKNQKGEELDSQMTHIIVEIDKFDKKGNQIKSDLDKLIYVMKNLEIVQALEELPKVLTEDWIQQAMKKLDKISMTPEQRFGYERMMAVKGSELEIKENEQKEIIREEKRRMAKEMKKLDIEIEKIAIATGLTIEEIKKL